MTAQRWARQSMLVAGGAAVIAMTAGCSLNAAGSLVPPPPQAAPSVAQSPGPAASPTGATTPTGSGAATSAGGGAASGSPRPTATVSPQPASPTACKAPDLRLSLGQGDGAGAGSQYPSLQFTNISGATCLLGGFPGVSYVSGDNGQQVGAAAVRSGAPGGTVTLAPGQMASAILQEANAADFPPDQCDPVPARGLRVYAPGDTAAMFLPAANTACSSTSMPGGQQLSVRTIVAGSGDEH